MIGAGTLVLDGAKGSSAQSIPSGPSDPAGHLEATSPALALSRPTPEPGPRKKSPAESDDSEKQLSGERRQPAVVRVPQAAKGRYSVVQGVAKPPKKSHGKVIRYMVEVEKGLPFDKKEFAAAVHRTLNDPRSWGSGGRMRFKRVDHGPVRFRVALSSPEMTNARCLPMTTYGELSCWNGRQAVINAKRWGQGVPGYRGDLAAYREYVINHEVGHALGHGHEFCDAPGKPAPVMAQQTISLQRCRPNPWPFRTARTSANTSADR
ncbi:DUF3152 domain-containing protein [Sphaerisporangium viridialbum]|uniref:DUF3152 domain-containing protein n=1 Tax=Sphaerisporangium viridialbum TaxID=46189 RepID=UPI003C726250